MNLLLGRMIEEGEQTQARMREYFRPFRTGRVQWLNDYSIEWSIENFAEIALAKQVDDMIISPEFSQTPHPLEWCLLMFPRGENHAKPGHVVVYLVNMTPWDVEVSSSCGIIDISCEIAELSINGRCEYQACTTGKNTRSQARWCKLEEFIMPERGLLRGKSLKVFCSIVTPMIYNIKENDMDYNNLNDLDGPGPSARLR